MALALVCLAGVGVAATILYVHGQIDRLGDGYTSFCTVNDSIKILNVYGHSICYTITWTVVEFFNAAGRPWQRSGSSRSE